MSGLDLYCNYPGFNIIFALNNLLKVHVYWYIILSKSHILIALNLQLQTAISTIRQQGKG